MSPATAPRRAAEVERPAGPAGRSDTGPATDASDTEAGDMDAGETDPTDTDAGEADTADETAETDETALCCTSAGSTKAPVSPETTEVTVSTAAKPTSTPSGSLRERAS